MNDNDTGNHCIENSHEIYIQHQALFFELEWNYDTISDEKVKVLLTSLKIPEEICSKVWFFSKDGCFSFQNFSLAIQNVQNSICGYTCAAIHHHIFESKRLSIPPINEDQWVAYGLVFQWLQTDENSPIRIKQAIRFLFHSNLSNEVLSKIWMHSDICIDGKVEREDFSIALHLTIFSKTNDNNLDGMINTCSLLPKQLQKENLINKQYRFLKLNAKQNSMFNKLKDGKPEDEMHNKLEESIKQIEDEIEVLKEEIKNGGPLFKREKLKRLFDENYLKYKRPNILLWIQKMRSRESSSRRHREPESIFQGDNIIQFSKSLIIKKKSTPKNKQTKQSEFQRRLTSDLIELTEEIEKLRRDTSSNFAELNKEFEQVKASVDNYEFLDEQVNESHLTKRDKEKFTKSSTSKANTKELIREDVIEKADVKVVENSTSFDEYFNTDVENSNSKKVQPSSRNNSLKRKDSKRNSLKRRLKLQQLHGSEQNLAQDFTDIFNQLSNKPDHVINDDVKSLIRQVSIEKTKNPYIDSNTKNSQLKKSSEHSQPGFLGLSRLESGEDTSDDQLADNLNSFEVKYPGKTVNSSTKPQDEARNSNLSNAETVLSNSTVTGKNNWKQKQGIFAAKLNSNKLDLSNNDKSFSELEEKSDLDLKKVFAQSKNFFEQSLKSRNSWKTQKTFNTQPSKHNHKFTKSSTIDSSEFSSSNKSFVDNSVKELLRNLSFNSRTKLLFFDDLTESEDKEALRNLLNQISSKPRKKSADVRTILRDLSFNENDMEIHLHNNNTEFDAKNRNSIHLDRFGKPRTDFRSSLFYTGEGNSGSDGLFYRRKNNDTFFNEQNAEEKRRSFSKELPNGDTNHINEEENKEEKPKKTKRVIRTKSGRIVKGLVSHENPNTVTFTEESEWLEKLCEEEANKNREQKDDTKNEQKRHNEDFVSFGFPVLPSPAHEKIEPPLDKTYEDERMLRRSKSKDVIEDEISVTKGKTWLQSLIDQNNQKNQEKPVVPNRKSSIETNAKVYPVKVEWNSSTYANEHVMPNSVNENIILPTEEIAVAESPYATINPVKTTNGIHLKGNGSEFSLDESDSKINGKPDLESNDNATDFDVNGHSEVIVAIPGTSIIDNEGSDISEADSQGDLALENNINRPQSNQIGASEDTEFNNYSLDLNSGNKPEVNGEFTIDNDTRGQAYMLPSEMRQQKERSKNSKDRRNTEDVSVLKRLKRFVGSRNDKNSDKKSKLSDDKKWKSSSMKNLSKSDIEMVPESGKYMTIQTGVDDKIAITKYKKFDPAVYQPEESVYLGHENDEDRVTLPSVKDKMKLFQNGSSESTNEVVMRKKKGSLFRGRPKSYGGFVRQASESELQAKNMSKSKEDLSKIGSTIIATDEDNYVAIDNQHYNMKNESHESTNLPNGINTSVSRNSVKLCVKDQRILKEIADNEQRENELRNKNQQSNNYNGIIDVSSNYHVGKNDDDKMTLKEQAVGVNYKVESNAEVSAIPEGLQKFINENVVSDST